MTVVDTPGTLTREVPARRAPRLTAGELEKQMAAERKDREAAPVGGHSPRLGPAEG